MYNTGNPVGSREVEDLSDNSEVFDRLMVGGDYQYPDRLGQARLSFEGFEHQAALAIQNAGYQFIGYYLPGPLTITSYNQVFSQLGDLWKAKASLTLPYTTTGNWATDQANFVSVGDNALRTQLAAITGGTLIGYKQVGRTVDTALSERKSITDFGALTSLSDNLAAVNAAIAAAGRGETIYVPPGDFAVSAVPPNSKGVRWEGPGRILAPWPQSQQNLYRLTKPFGIYREYLDQIWQVMRLTNRAIRVFTYGDSTVAGGFNYIDWEWFVQNLIPEMAAVKGLRNGVVVTNRGVGGSAITAWNPVPDIDPITGPDLIIVKYALNDPYAANALQTYETALRTQLAAIRADADGSIYNVAILIVGPNAAWDEDGDFRNSKWFESLRSVHEAAAKDYQCAFFDPYALMQDASKAANRWLDKPNTGNNSALHPTNTGQSQIWGALFDFIVGESMITRYKANQFKNNSAYYGWPKANFSFQPMHYANGITVEIALAADGWPRDGMLYTLKNPEGQAHQRLTPLGSNGATFIRNSDLASTFFGVWHGMPVALTLQNSWAYFGAPYQLPRVMISEEDVVTLDGMIKPGTVAAGTVLFTLPSEYRPISQRIIRAPTDSGMVELEFFSTNGNVTLRSGTVASYLSLSGLNFIR